jgi:siderophore ferric iron reductase
MHSSATNRTALVQIPVQLANYQQLFSLSVQLHPYLQHSEFKAADTLALPVNTSAPLLRLYNNLKHQHPRAGHAYWAHKCWQLAIWQPVLLSLISIYALKVALPLSQLKVHCHELSVFGYKLNISTQFKGNIHDMITYIGNELQCLTQSFYQQLSQHCSLRKNFCQRLLSDQLLEGLAKVQQYIPQLSDDALTAQTHTWLSALKLPTRSLQTNSKNEVIRSSCCLEYRLDSQDYCTNCPKQRVNNHAKT